MSRHPFAVLLAAASTVATGCSAPHSPAPAAESSAPSTTAVSTGTVSPIRPPRTVKWIDLQPGDCLAGRPPTDPAEVTVTVVDCGAPHLAEAFLRVQIPVDTALTDTASARCEAGFVDYSGGSAAAAGLSISYLIDSEQDRTSNNPYPSTVICLAQNSTGAALTASARR